MQQFYAYVQLIVSLLLNLLFIVSTQPITTHGQQLNCIDQAVQDAEVLARKQLDLNQDGNPDDVVIYGQDDLYALVAVNQRALGCKIILNDRLTSRQMLSGRRVVKVQQVELVDLTGDNQPELHIWLDLSTPTFRASDALHVIYKLQGESMEKVFVRSQCLDMSSFEFRTAPDGAKLIYLDEDRRCAPPSSRRDYEISRWDAKTTRFELVESGKIDKSSPDPFWDAFLSVFIIPVVIVIASVVIIGVSTVWYEKRKKSARSN